MSKSLTLAVPIILAASVITISSSTTTSRAADECLRGPNGTAPDGSHWYYRVDRSTGRHCWYLGAAGRSVRSVSERTSQQTRKRVEQHSRNSQSATQPAEKRPDLPPPAPPVPDSKAATSFFAQYWASLFGNAEPPKITPTAEAPQVSPPAKSTQTATQTAKQAGATPTAQQAPQITPPTESPKITPPEEPLKIGPPAEPQIAPSVEASQTTQRTEALQTTQRAETPRPAAPADASRPTTSATASSYAQEPEQADAQEDMPLVWPVLTPAEAAPTLKYQHMIAVLAGALALAGILMALVYRLASVRVDRQRRQPERARWDPATRTMLPMPPLGDADAFSFPRSGTPARRLLLPNPLPSTSTPELDRELPRKPLKLPFELDREMREPAWSKLPYEPAREARKPAQRPPEPDREARKPILPKRPPELDRGAREPHEARRLRELRELREGLETRLEQLRDARRQSAA